MSRDDRHQQAGGAGGHVAEGMRDVTRADRVGAGTADEDVVADAELERALDDVEDLGLVPMHMIGRSLPRRYFLLQHGVGAAHLIAADEHARMSVHDPHGVRTVAADGDDRHPCLGLLAHATLRRKGDRMLASPGLRVGKRGRARFVTEAAGLGADAAAKGRD